MPPTYLGCSRRHGLRQCCGIYRRHIICPRHWPPACRRSWAEFNFAGKPVAVGDCRRWRYFMWTSSVVEALFIKTIRSVFKVKWLKIAQFDLHFDQTWVCWRPIADTQRTLWGRSPNDVITGCNRQRSAILRCWTRLNFAGKPAINAWFVSGIWEPNLSLQQLGR